ncbi:MAG: bifunctional DNA-formamidopyrimidine glycosylase/DNA-(apurinic or apyrimidinic site) lyase [Porticoccaceae bacterium]
MPELPEVETTLRGVAPYVVGQQISQCVLRETRLRYPIPAMLSKRIVGREVAGIWRRGKYLLFAIDGGHMLVHLGMSGSLRLVAKNSLEGKHDHVDFVLASGMSLRYTDPRRFGVIAWVEGDPLCHPLLCSLGPEPLTEGFSGEYLYQLSRKRKVPVKSFIMNANVVVGVGNIYANEALFLAGVHPLRQAGRVSRESYRRLAETIVGVLAAAIDQGGTTLRDFVGGDGKPGYFSQSLNVYGRGGQPCVRCGRPLKEDRLAQRTTVFCPFCQR